MAPLSLGSPNLCSRGRDGIVDRVDGIEEAALSQKAGRSL